MNGIDGIILTFLLNALWQIPAVVAGGLLGARLLRRAPARQRHALWLAVAVSCMALPAASLRRPDPASGPPVVAGVPAASRPAVTGLEPFAPGERRSARYAPAAGAAVTAGYALLLLFRGVRLGQTWRRTLGLARRASPLDVPERAIPLVAHCRRALGVASPLAFYSSGEVAGPVTLGALRPAILLPPRFLDDASPDEALSALGHEMAHVRRRDYAANLLCEALLLPVAFHPAVRLVRRRLAETREMACDEAVLETLLGRRSYARSLLSLAAGVAGLPRPTHTLGVLDAHTLEVRMKSILENRPRVGLPAAHALLGAALLLLGGITLAASGVTVRAVAADARGDLRPFVGTWTADWTPDSKEGGNGQKVRALDMEVHPNGRIVQTWYKYLKGGGAPQKEVVLVTDYAIEGRTLKYKTRVEKFAFPGKPAGPAELRESLELQGGDDAIWRSLSNSYVEALKKRGEPVPPLPPPVPMKRQP
ncbi:MAG TPA: M56 family metallopeptidase [Thermoanaerobaculia bacterium]|nr:M56 family metallopeptidase [Thermoanaerobaculia bacterium]